MTAADPVVGLLRAAGCVFAEEEAALLIDAAADPEALERLVARRVAGEPLETILGWVEFAGLRLAVAPGVFVPRRRSELLVTEVARRAAPGAVVVELCCGVAAVAAALRSRRPDLDLWASDIDPIAVECARANLTGTQVLHGDLYDALPAQLRGRVDVLVANAPYVPSGQIALMPPEARLHEPAVALDGGRDGLDVHRRIAAAMTDWLAPDGQVVIEISAAQAPLLVELLTAAGAVGAEVVRDDSLEATAVRGWLSTTY